MKPLIYHYAEFRFYGSLNDFLPAHKRRISNRYAFEGAPAILDAVQAQGVPHPEVGRLVVNKETVDWNFRLSDGVRVAVYPHWADRYADTDFLETMKPIRFILDVNLGKLCRYLRLLGLDGLWHNHLSDDQIIRVAAEENRIILTRDISLLKHKAVRCGYWVRHTTLIEQANEVMMRFDLRRYLQPFSRCMRCNSHINRVEKNSVKEKVPDTIFRLYGDFFRCAGCGKIYWQGSHYQRMRENLDATINGLNI